MTLTGEMYQDVCAVKLCVRENSDGRLQLVVWVLKSACCFVPPCFGFSLSLVCNS